MPRTNLAKKLISANNPAERKRLLTENAALADEKLAVAIKEMCYATWATEPTKAQKAASALESLFKFRGTDAIGAFFKWILGISDLTRGKLESAVKNLNIAGAGFLALGREHESAQTQVPKLIALALLGRYEEAVVTGEKALAVFEKYNDDLAAGKVEKNLGNIVSRQETHLKAEKYYLSAIKRFIGIGDKSEQTSAENGLAITYTHLNDFRKAEKFFAVALENARAGNMLPIEAGIEASIGNLALFRGRYDEALRFLELSRRKYEALNMPHQTAVAGLEIADIYRELNLTREAFDIYREVADKLSKLKLQGDEARARANLGRAAIVLGERSIARKEMKKAAQLYAREGNKTGAAAVKLAQARFEIEGGKTRNALPVLLQAEKLLAESNSFQYRLALKLLKAEALGAEEGLAEPERLLSEVLTEARRHEQPHFALAALNLMGKTARATGATRRAKEHFKKAVGLIEKLRAPLAAEEFRMSFLADNLEPFENLAAIYLSENRFKEAFFYIEKARSRSLADIVGSRHDEPDHDNPPEITDRLREVREELNWYYARLRRAADREVPALQDEIKKGEKLVAALMRQVESTRQGNGRIKSNSPDLTKLRAQLGTSTALVEFVHLDGEFSVFVIDDRSVHFVRCIATPDEILSLLEGLQFQFGALRYGRTVPARFAADLKRKADLYLEKLYEKLLKPLEEHTGKRNLVIIPVGPLYYVPFHALRMGEKYVVEDREVVYGPSAAVWQVLSEKPKHDLKKALLIGFADENIPLVDEEINSLGKLFPKAKSLTGEAATFAGYTNNAPDFDLLHLACHGQFRVDNPMFSSLHLADGWVTVRDICGQKLNAGLVTLSACETGLNKVFAGDEIIGLARGFLTAGASSLVLSLWTVNDEATLRLMRAFYENLQRGNTVAASLRIAQNEFIARGEHPYFWSPFVVIGK